MKLSVIIPVFNGEKFIKRAYESVKSQDLEAVDYEIVFIDNNSTDKTATIINELLKKDSKVKLYNQPKQGEANARNKGLEKAQGQYIHQLDVDDQLYPGALKKMMAVLDNNSDVDAVVGKMVKSHKGINETVKPSDETNEVIFKQKPYWGLRWFIDLSTVVGEAAFLHRKTVFDKIGNYNTHISMGTDTAVDIKLGMTCNVAFIDTYVYLYYKHFDSITAESKRQINQVYHIWSRQINADLPLYYEHDVPHEYKNWVFLQLYSTMGKIIYYSENYHDRLNVYKQIPKDIVPLKLKWPVKMYLYLLVICPVEILLKFYVYYFSKWYVTRNLKNF